MYITILIAAGILGVEINDGLMFYALRHTACCLFKHKKTTAKLFHPGVTVYQLLIQKLF